MAKRRSQSDHDKMVKHVANVLIEKNFRGVKADLPGFEKPAEIKWKKTGKGHVPDVTGLKEQFKLFEVETADSIDDQHTEDQWTLFAKHAKEQNEVFWIVVPERSVAAARRRLGELNIQANVWGV